MRIVEDDLSGAAIVDLLRLHLDSMHAHSPPGSVFAFDIDRLRASDVTFWSAWDGDTLLGCGALKELDALTGEIKSMRTHSNHLRRGVAAAILDHMIAVAQARGYGRISLETGSGDAFEPALWFYRRYGFVDGPAFGGYQPSAFNQFLHLDL